VWTNNVRVYENQFSGHQVVASGQTVDGAQDMLKIMGAILQPFIVNTPEVRMFVFANKRKKLWGLSPPANYTDRAIAACQQS
jgi:hypothetical protein